MTKLENMKREWATLGVSEFLAAEALATTSEIL